MSRLHEFAPAKINLTLKVLGRRADGYHELHSLVAFPSVGDRLDLVPGPGLSLALSGAFSAGLESGGGNLVLRAARAFRERVPGALLGDFHLRKDLPVASGIGGGSADAAAALRLLARANPGALDGAALAEIALGIGSDVPACLFARATVMAGRGESLAPLAGLPLVHILLVNPGVPVSSREVFARLDAPSPPRPRPDRAGVPAFPDSRRLAGYVCAEGNDLLPAAREIAPVIPAVIGEISAQAGCLAASLSGSGATCFGLFAEAGEAHAATLRIAGAHPGWWAVHAELN